MKRWFLLVLLVLVFLPFSRACGARGKPSEELVNAYLQAVQRQDRRALERLFTREYWDNGKWMRYSDEAFDREMERRLAKYANLNGAKFQVGFLSAAPSSCAARITLEGRSQAARNFQDDLGFHPMHEGVTDWLLIPEEMQLGFRGPVPADIAAYCAV